MKHRYLRAGAFSCAAAMLIATGAQALSVEEAREILQRSYVDKLPNAAKEAETLDELFSYTDDYTYYMTGEEYEAFLSEVEGEVSFVGIGAEITYGETGITIVSVLKGGGAEKAGLTSGDIIIAIDGESCVPGTAEAREKLLGDERTQVTLTVLRTDGSEKDFTVTRTLITQTNTTVSVADGVGYIDCDSFGSQTGTYFQDGVRKNNSAVRAWVVDLRGNGGGLTSAAVTALGTFAGKGDLAYFVDRDGDAIPERYAGADLTDKPAIVLMNAGSASASEIFAGGILGTGSGIVIGERSYGKGVAQIVYDGTNCPYLTDDAVKVTAYRFYCAGGNTTDRLGVIPTLYVPQGTTSAAAELLAGAKPADGSAYLHLVLNGLDFYVDIAAAKQQTLALEGILRALAPDTELYWGENGAEERVTSAQAREKLGAPQANLDFNDVASSAYAGEINALAAYRIVFGDKGAFRPDDTMTRAEVCALLAQALDVYSSADGYFTDVPKGSWYASSVNAMASLGLISGVGGGRFAPNATMTQEEFITVLGRLVEFLNLDARAYLDEHPLAILQPLAQYKNFSPWAIRCADLLTGSVTDESGEAVTMYCTDLEGIEPKEPILREQAAAALYNALRTTGTLKY